MSRAPSFHVSEIPVDDIHVIGDRRPCEEGAVDRLVAGIEAIGLQTPITVRPAVVPLDDSGETYEAYALVTGRHRLQAYRKMGLERIPAMVREIGEVDAELWEISENLHRADLTKEQRDEQIRRFAELLREKRATRVSVQPFLN